MSSSADSIVVLAMGGTIDKVYTVDGQLEIGPPAARRILADIATSQPIEVESVVSKDSLDLTDRDRDKLARAIASTPANRIVVTHGTDTMTETAVHLAGSRAEGKTVVLTGSLQPAAMSVTDAPFNLGFAVAAAQMSGPGVYVAMSGQLFPAGQATKDPSSGVFAVANRTDGSRSGDR